ncbi:spore germination protein GerPE [Longirhabdus pacifica]|uniref:spore germination protein GerPE n=1 Tax=Longirhabdus pacifica TaxID=2305227 RepID=UPI001009328B|nr:spore germination protein GerPE [Longirhabdus pacifica]
MKKQTCSKPITNTKRTSVLKELYITNIGEDSTLRIGDTYAITPYSLVYALQRKIPTFRGDEGNFEPYSVFRKDIPLPEITEQVNLNIINENPYIHVGRVKIIATSVAPVVHIGSNCIIRSESRTLNIRQFNSTSVP